MRRLLLTNQTMLTPRRASEGRKLGTRETRLLVCTETLPVLILILHLRQGSAPSATYVSSESNVSVVFFICHGPTVMSGKPGDIEIPACFKDLILLTFSLYVIKAMLEVCSGISARNVSQYRQGLLIPVVNAWQTRSI